MPSYKHVGRVKNNRRKVVVAYRVIPGEPDNCLVVQTENLSADEHDTLIKLVESDAGQTADEFAEAMARSYLPDGRIMLAAFHATGKLNKLQTNQVEMTPNGATVIGLDELNKMIAEQKGITVADLAVKGPDGTVQPTDGSADEPVDPVATYTQTEAAPSAEGIITDEQLAAQYRSQADALFKEAKALREQAEELVPTKKKTSKKITESATG